MKNKINFLLSSFLITSLLMIPFGLGFGFHYSGSIETDISECDYNYEFYVSGIDAGQVIKYRFIFDNQYKTGDITESGWINFDIEVPTNPNNYTMYIEIAGSSLETDSNESVYEIDKVYEREVNVEVKDSDQPRECNGLVLTSVLNSFYFKSFIIILILVLSIIYFKFFKKEDIII